jgi:hypothetical protein
VGGKPDGYQSAMRNWATGGRTNAGRVRRGGQEAGRCSRTTTETRSPEVSSWPIRLPGPWRSPARPHCRGNATARGRLRRLDSGPPGGVGGRAAQPGTNVDHQVTRPRIQPRQQPVQSRRPAAAAAGGRDPVFRARERLRRLIRDACSRPHSTHQTWPRCSGSWASRSASSMPRCRLSASATRSSTTAGSMLRTSPITCGGTATACLTGCAGQGWGTSPHSSRGQTGRTCGGPSQSPLPRNGVQPWIRSHLSS